MLVVGAIVFTANEIAGLVTGLKDGYYDRQIDDALVALAAPVGARLVVSVVIRLAPMLWLVVQPSMLTELFLALDAHRAVTSIDHDDVRAGGDGTRRLVFELFPPARSTMLSAVLFSMPVFTYASVVLVLEIVRQVVKRNLASTTLLVDLTLIKLEDLSFTLRYVEMISLAVAFIVRLFLRRGDRVVRRACTHGAPVPYC